MPSPFPGMDPFLEGKLWPAFHNDLIVEIKRQLVPKVRPRYAIVSEIYFLSEPEEEITPGQKSLIPDLGIQEYQKGPLTESTAESRGPVQVKTVLPQKTRKSRLLIRDVEKKRVVTVLEILSPANKNLPGRKQYLNKRRKILLSDANLVEIDLLHQGQRLPFEGPCPSAPYYVYVNRAWKRSVTDVWPISMREPLPTVPVPLKRKDAEVNLEMQAAFNRVYDEMGYDLLLNYQTDLPACLSTEEKPWVEDWLKSKNLH